MNDKEVRVDWYEPGPATTRHTCPLVSLGVFFHLLVDLPMRAGYISREKRVGHAREALEMETHRTVMNLIYQRLYFGQDPGKREMAMNAGILKRLNARYPWDQLAKAVEGLALRRDQGKLGINPKESVSLRWLIDGDQMLNQVEVCLDAVYLAPAKPVKRGGEVSGIQSLLSHLTGEG